MEGKPKREFKHYIEEYLSDEAEYFYRYLFSESADKNTVDKYIQANLKFLPQPEEGIRRLVTARADIEAAELAWRYLSADNPLTRKIHIMLFLAETTPANYSKFFSEKNSRFTALVSLSYHTLRSVLKILKGKYLMKRWRLG